MESSKLAKIEQKPVIKVFKRKPCDSGRNRALAFDRARHSLLSSTGDHSPTRERFEQDRQQRLLDLRSGRRSSASRRMGVHALVRQTNRLPE